MRNKKIRYLLRGALFGLIANLLYTSITTLLLYPTTPADFEGCEGMCGFMWAVTNIHNIFITHYFFPNPDSLPSVFTASILVGLALGVLIGLIFYKASLINKEDDRK